MTKTQYGRSMIEMLGVLAIIGVLSVGGITGYTKAMEKYKSNQSVEQLTTILTNIKSLGLRKRSFSGITTSAAIKLKAAPEEMIRTTSDGKKELRNVYEGEVIVGSDDTKARNFYVQYKSLPKPACISMATQDWGSNKVAVFVSNNNAEPSISTIKTTASCSTESGSSVCWNQMMTPSAAATGCSCS